MMFISFPVVVPQASKDLLKALPGIKTLEVTAKYPTAEGRVGCCDGNLNSFRHLEYGLQSLQRKEKK